MSRILLAFFAIAFCLQLVLSDQPARLGIREIQRRDAARSKIDTETQKYGKVVKSPTQKDSKVGDSLAILYQILKADPNGISQTMPRVDNLSIYRIRPEFHDENVNYFGSDYTNGSSDILYSNVSASSESDDNGAFYGKPSGTDLVGIVGSNRTVSGLSVFYSNFIETANKVPKDFGIEDQNVTSAANYDEIGNESGKVSSGFEKHITSANQHTDKIEKIPIYPIENSETTASAVNFRVSFETTISNLPTATHESSSAENSLNRFKTGGNDPIESNTLKSSTDGTNQPTSIDHPHGIRSTTSDSIHKDITEPTTAPTSITPRELRNQSAILEDFRTEWPVEKWISQGLFTEEFLSKIPIYWLSFPPPSDMHQYVLAGLYIVIMVVGAAGNLLVIVMFCRCKSLKTPGNILVMNLACSDLLMLLKMPIFIYNSINLGPALGDIGCKVYAFIGGLTGTVSIATLAAIGLDRYYVIVHPLDPLRRTTRVRARLCVAFVWTYGFAFSVLPLTDLDFSRYVPEGYLTSCSFDYLNPDPKSRAFILVFFFAAWVMPFFVLTFSYVAIYHVVVKAREVRPDGDSSRHCRENDKRRTEIRLATVVLGVVGLWFISWTPYAVVALLGVSGNQQLLSPIGSMIPALFAKMASAVDPYVYAINHPRFRQEVCNIWNRARGKPQFRASQARSLAATIREPVGPSSHSSHSDELEMNVLKPEQAEPEALGTPVQLPTLELARQQGAILPPTWYRPPKPRRNRSTSLRLKSKVKDVKEEVVFSSFSEMPTYNKHDVQ